MKTTLTIATILIATQISFAQENKLWLSLSSGVATTTNGGKNNLTGNGYNVQADAFVPLFRKGWDGTVKGGSMALGLNVLADYTGVKNLSPNNAATADQYQIFGGNMRVASQSNAKMSGSFSGLAGLQARFSFGEFNFSPSLNAGYLQFNQKGFVQNGSANINGQRQERDLVKTDDQTTSGMVFKPQVKFGYNLTPGFSLFISPAIVMGPQVHYNTQYLVPQGGFNDKNTYEARQLANGTWESKTSSSKYRFTEINFGLSLAIGKKKTPKTNVKPGGAVSSSYAKLTESKHQDTTTAPTKKAGVSTSRSGIIRTGNAKLMENTNTETPDTTSTNQRLSMTPTTPKQSQGQNFGEKVSSGLQSGAGALTQGASLLGGALGGGFSGKVGPIKGVIVKGGKPGAQMFTITTNENGAFEFTAAEAGNYKFSFTVPNEAQGKSISEKGLKKTNNLIPAINNISSRISTGNTNVDDSGETSDAARPGSPIGGIVVKGGKNPSPGNGWGAINVVTDSNGEVTFPITEPGDYKFTLIVPSQPQGKSINEKGVSSTKGHKNQPQGKSINEKGVSGSKPQPKAQQKTKVVEKATSGLKDVVRTQV